MDTQGIADNLCKVTGVQARKTLAVATIAIVPNFKYVQELLE